MKKCKKCGSTEFYISGKCKPCRRALTAKYRLEHPEKAIAATKRWCNAHIERVKVMRAKADAKWAKANQDKKKTIFAKWYVNNPESNRIRSHNRRAKERDAVGTLSKGISDKLYKLQKGKCACGCGQKLGDNYHRDHRMPLALGGTNEDWNIQLLTPTCNLQKQAKHPIDFMQSKGFLL